MKKIGLIISFLTCVFAFSQVAIGKNNVSTKVILEFGTEGKAIILPIVDKSDTNEVYTNGTFIMDKADNKIKVYQNGAWLDLSDAGSVVVERNTNSEAITTARVISTSSEVDGGVVIGNAATAQANNVKGVLVLEDSTKALVLPHVANPHTAINSPTAGTMCYDTESNSIAVFDGKVWSYWK